MILWGLTGRSYPSTIQMAERKSVQCDQFRVNTVYKVDLLHLLGAWIGCWLERRTRDRKVAGSNPGWSDGRISFSSVNFLCWLLFGVRCTLLRSRATAVARKRPRTFCQKGRWRVTPKYAYTFDPTKSEWYATVQALCGNLSGNELTRNSSVSSRSQSSQLA